MEADEGRLEARLDTPLRDKVYLDFEKRRLRTRAAEGNILEKREGNNNRKC